MEETDDADALIAEEENTTTTTSICTSTLVRARLLWSQLTKEEISGSVGDLGTFCPLFVALARQRSIHAVPALFLAGLSNFLTGLQWDVPMPVQPMKSIAAVALLNVLSQSQVTAAGIIMGVLLLALGLTNAIECVAQIIPLAVVAGMQVGVGMSLSLHGLAMSTELSWYSSLDCMLLAVLCGMASLYLLQKDKPVGIYLVGLGAIVALIELDNFEWSASPILTWAVVDIDWNDWKTGFLEGAIPQLPLSTLNSVISVCALAHSLYPEKRIAGEAVLSRREVCCSVGVMNLIACPLGGMSSCHGAGGLAGQHKFGARHGASIVFLGSCKMLLALLLGDSFLTILDKFPVSILGVMLMLAGQELALTGIMILVQAESSNLRTRIAVSLITAIVILGLKKTHYGALIGWLAHMLYGGELLSNHHDYARVDETPIEEEEEEDNDNNDNDEEQTAVSVA
jgi:MFS superfamily sulfate permease-like transporter